MAKEVPQQSLAEKLRSIDNNKFITNSANDNSKLKKQISMNKPQRGTENSNRIIGLQGLQGFISNKTTKQQYEEQ